MGPLGAKSIVNKLGWAAALAAVGNYRLVSQLPLPGARGCSHLGHMDPTPASPHPLS